MSVPEDRSYRVLAISTEHNINNSTAEIEMIETQPSFPSYTLAHEWLTDIRQNIIELAKQWECSIIMWRHTVHGAEVVVSDDIRTEIKLWIHDTGRRGQTQVKFGGEEDYLSDWGYHVDFEEAGVDLINTRIRMWDIGENPDGALDRPTLKRSFAGSSIDGRIVTLKERL